MRECENCKNYIPEGMKICPHCGKLPPTLWPQFGVYAALTLIAVACAVYFRPFLNGPAMGEVAQGVLWVAAVIFIVFGVIFLGVSVIIARDYKKPDLPRQAHKAGESALYKNEAAHRVKSPFLRKGSRLLHGLRT